jgi:hypothetical protein
MVATKPVSQSLGGSVSSVTDTSVVSVSLPSVLLAAGNKAHPLTSTEMINTHKSAIKYAVFSVFIKLAPKLLFEAILQQNSTHFNKVQNFTACSQAAAQAPTKIAARSSGDFIILN